MSGVRSLARSALRRAPAGLVADSDARFGRIDGTFVRDDGSSVRLYAGYRDGIKQWRFYWWPVCVLHGLAQRVELPSDAAGLLAQIMRARTLPAPPEELASFVAKLAERFPDELSVTSHNPCRVELVPREQDIAALVRRYQATAKLFRDTAAAHGLALDRARVLDVGTGSGRLAFALAGLGAGEVVGVDLDPEGGVPSLEREPVRERLTGGRDARLVTADVSRLDAFDDGSFDLVCSMSAIEHFGDLPAALSELARVLRPGGLMYHGVDPWFGKAGGHSLCTADFPWGHLRLTEDELVRYLDEERPNECSEAIEFYRVGFQSPRRTLAESRAAFEDAGVEILDWRELPVPLRDPHRRLAGDDVLGECRHLHPAVTHRDLLTISYSVVARR